MQLSKQRCPVKKSKLASKFAEERELTTYNLVDSTYRTRMYSGRKLSCSFVDFEAYFSRFLRLICDVVSKIQT